MRILVINWRCARNPLAGGAEVYLQEIFKRIVERGHSVTQLAVRFPGSSEIEILDGIRVVRFGGAQTFNFAVWARLDRILREGDFDLVIDDLNKIPFYSPWFCDRPVLALMMHVFRASIFREVALPFATYVYLTESLIPACYKNNLFAVLSPSSRDDLARMGVRNEQMTVIPPGTDSLRFHPDWSRKGENLILHVGRLKRYKSTEHLLQAVQILKSRGRAFQVKIVGEGDDLPRLRELSTKLGLDTCVQFTGFVPEARKVELYQSAAVLVENSVKEGWGLIVMEANACGTPVVAARSPGLVDSVCDGKTGLLYDYGDVKSLAEKLELLLDSPDLRREMGENGVAWAGRYSWDRAADAMLELICRAAMKPSLSDAIRLSPNPSPSGLA
ncbi:MAG: glycosyltransferase family 4 protein [candidate division WOR-3 bacterium]